MKLEKFHHDMVSFRSYLWRTGKYFLFATALIVFALIPGILGFHWLGKIDLYEAFINSINIIGSQDPPYPIKSKTGYLFTGFYGIFCETIILLSIVILVTPTIHRVLHRLHIRE